LETGTIKEITEGNIVLEKALTKEHDPGEILRLLPEGRGNLTSSQKKRAVSDAVKGANEDALSAAADFMARKNEDIDGFHEGYGARIVELPAQFGQLTCCSRRSGSLGARELANFWDPTSIERPIDECRTSWYCEHNIKK